MKKIIAISFILLASVFCFKNIIAYVASSTDSVCYILDTCEEESSEKGDIDEKGDTEEFQVDVTRNLLNANSIYKNIFRNHITSGYYTPYFEINSPPPEN